MYVKTDLSPEDPAEGAVTLTANVCDDLVPCVKRDLYISKGVHIQKRPVYTRRDLSLEDPAKSAVPVRPMCLTIWCVKRDL